MLLPQSQTRCTNDGDGSSMLNHLPSVDLPSLPDGFINFSARLGDALLFGLGNPARDLLGINGTSTRALGRIALVAGHLSALESGASDMQR